MKILQFPLMKITIWFILGIVFSYNFNPKPTTTFIIIGIFLVPFILTLYLSKKDYIQKNLLWNRYLSFIFSNRLLYSGFT